MQRHIQRLEGGVITNLTEPGRDIQDALRGAYSSYGHEFPSGCGMMDGGCGIVAEALQAGFEGSTLAGWWSDDVLHHVVCRVGDFFVDSDGLATEHDMKVKMSFEMHGKPGYIFPVTRKDMAAAGIPMRPDLSMVMIESALDWIGLMTGMVSFERGFNDLVADDSVRIKHSLQVPSSPCFFLPPVSLD